ncbi:shikimate dehydrogenase [uncultured Friedmanniella sp.]|uniref:shikimate dehydrogenase n=1 Tax=uncultured Friedmanniella sp. TaxID=335381 RepID=UPI0035CA1B03
MTAEVGRSNRHCAVLGSPIAHSLSPALHRAAYGTLGLDWSYDRYEVDEAGLGAFVAGRDASWRGLSLTMPLKVAALALGEVDPLAAQAGAANTLVFEADGRRRLFNTDVGGLVWALRRAGADRVSRVTVLGAGATARSSLVSAARLGAQTVTVVARTPSRAEPLLALGVSLAVQVRVQEWSEPLPTADVLVSTAVAGAADSLAEAAAASAPLVFDAVYDPWPTRLAQAAATAGCAVVNGLDLLVGQALLQLELMTGSGVAAEVLYAAGHDALAAAAVGD